MIDSVIQITIPVIFNNPQKTQIAYLTYYNPDYVAC